MRRGERFGNENPVVTHARRRAKLYHIPEDTIIKLIEMHDLKIGRHEIIERISELMFPLKVVFEVQHDQVTVITNYPYKKGRNR